MYLGNFQGCTLLTSRDVAVAQLDDIVGAPRRKAVVAAAAAASEVDEPLGMDALLRLRTQPAQNMIRGPITSSL